MSMKNLDHSAVSKVTIERLEMDSDKIVKAVDQCTGEVAKLYLKEIPPPVIHNEIVSDPPSVINRVETPDVKVPVNIQFNFEALSKTLFQCTVILGFVLFVSIVFGELFIEWIHWELSRWKN